MSSGKLIRVYSLDHSTPNAGAWDVVLETGGAASITQATALRRPAQGTVNGRNVAVYSGVSSLVMPLDASGTGNNQTTKFCYGLSVKPATVVDVQRLITIAFTSGVANAEKLHIYANNATLRAEIYMTNSTGRVLTTGNVLTAGVRSTVWFQYDSSLGGDANAKFFVGATDVGGTFANLGAGATLGVLPTVTGNAIIGAFNNTNTPTQPIANGGEVGPYIVAGNDVLTTAELTALQSLMNPG